MNTQMCPTCLKMIPVISTNCSFTLPVNPELFCQCPTGALYTLTVTSDWASGTVFVGNPLINQQSYTFATPPEPIREIVPQAFYDAFSDEEVQF